VKTALIRCISHIQYWTVWNKVQTFENSRIHIVETKQVLSSVYQLNFTSNDKPKSKPLIRHNSMCFWDLSRCDGKLPIFSALISKPKSYVWNDVKTALIRCISLIQHWTVWNEFETFEFSRIHIVETKQGIWNEYKSNFTSMAKRKSNLLIPPNSKGF
jgi:hypothetical protein